MIETVPSWFPKFTSCGKCDPYGFIIESGVARKCTCKVSFDHKIKILRGLIESNVLSPDSSTEIVDSFLSLDFDSYKGVDEQDNISKLRKFVESFDEKYSGLNMFFTGISGTQKTTLSKIIIKLLLEKGKSCYYILANDLIQLLIDSAREEGKKSVIHEILVKDFLVIDEFDDSKIISYASGWQRKHLFPWIKNRLETIHRSTCFISNRQVTDIGDYFEEAIQDLIQREVFTFTFKDKYYTYKDKLDLSSIWD